MLSKLNSNGDLIYINFYDHGWIWGGAIVTSDNGLLIRTGNTLIKTTNSGNIQWTTSFTGTKYYLAPIEVSDGYILTGHTSPNNEISFYKYNLQGIQQWGGYRKSNYFGTPPTFHKKNNGNICAVFNDATIEFDKDLNIIKQASIQGNMGMIGKKLCYLTDGTPILTGIRPGSSDLFIAKLDDAYHTNCDAAGLPIVLETDTSFLIPTPVSKSTHNLNTINHVFVYDTFTIVTKLACPRNFYLGNDTLVCASAAVILQNQFIEPFENFLWSTGATTSSITVTQTGKYWLLVTYNCGEETLIDTITVTFNPPIITNLGTDVVVCEKETYTFKAPSCDSCSYWWSDNSVGDTMMVSTIGDYWLMVTDSIGCVYSDTVAFNISKCECFLWVPNSFTPNNDGLNDVFQPSYYCDLASFDLKILNRWGQPIFSSENAMESWNGKDRNASVQSGVYFYTVTYTPIIKGQIDKPITQTGVITVIY